MQRILSTIIAAACSSLVLAQTPTVAGAGTPAVATPQAACTKSPASWVSTNAYDWKAFGSYTVQNNSWGGAAGLVTWANSSDCWGVTSSQTSEVFNISGAPGVQRGWSQNCATFMGKGGGSWTVQSGMGIQVSALTKEKIHWAFSAPAAYPASRWNALIDTYFWAGSAPTSCSSDRHEWNSKIIDLMVVQQVNDQVLANGSYYAGVAGANHATTVTIAGSTYLTYVDNPNQAFNAPGGHTIEMFLAPTAFGQPVNAQALALWGSNDAVTDLAAIIKFWSQPNPKDDAGKPILYGNGTAITTPVISPSYWLGETYLAFEQDYGQPFVTSEACIAMQNEPDCP